MNAVVSVIGKDRVGILARVATECANANINVVEVTQTLLQDTFAMTMLVNIDEISMKLSEFAQHMDNVGKEMGLVIHVMHEDIFNSMHKIQG
ncbi:ACT domain-containing protein [Merdibacter massiliensis]|uniref:ACT domain-containing protein n=1 Tax=Merdibacter massiliensis TaxID=1871030 RepID=UPI00096A3EAB|nr:ACT domain-containing protein [Merdibacter massiliensis]